MHTFTTPIRLVVVDIDGCLTSGEGRLLSFDVLEALSHYNYQAQQAIPHIPSITLCTGRPVPYVELMTQAIAGFLPALYEHGAGMYDPRDYTFHTHPTLPSVFSDHYYCFRTLLEEHIVRQELGYLQPGKELSFTLYPRPTVTTEELASAISALLLLEEYGFVAQKGRREINILPQHINKGIGVQWLAEHLTCSLTEIAGIGDTLGDLAFLQRVGFTAAPSNAVDAVKAQVAYISSFANGYGVVDILQQCITRNQELSPG